MRRVFTALFSSIIILTACTRRHQGGALPVWLDEHSINKSEMHLNQLDTLQGRVIRYKKHYDCNDLYASNATAIISSEGKFVTLYLVCQTQALNAGQQVRFVTVKVDKHQGQEIYERFSKKSSHYGYWQCISCKYPNTFGKIIEL